MARSSRTPFRFNTRTPDPMADRRVVLVLTGPDDPTADAVAEALDRRGAITRRFNSGEFPANACLSAQHNGDGWVGELSGREATINIEQVRSVYYRRPSRFTFPPGMSAANRAYAEAEARIAIGGILTTLECPWVSHPHDVARAEWKPLQLQVAANVGLATPRTLISNDASAAREFARSCTGPVICKPMSSVTLAEGGRTLITYSTVVNPESFDETVFATTANLIQEWVPKEREARVTVVGPRILAVAIDADSDRARIDWRADYANLRYEPIDAPPDVADKVLRYLAAFNLHYGAFDFIITPAGEWVMLECNPAGQWLWLHHAADLPIPAAIAGLLTEDVA